MNMRLTRYALNFVVATCLAATMVACSKKVEAPAMDDGTLVSNVKAALAADPATKDLNLEVAAHSGVVELSGGFDDYAKLDRALAIVRGVDGVKSLEDKTVHREGSAPAAASAAPAAAPSAPASPDAAPAAPAATTPAAPAAPPAETAAPGAK